MIWIILPIAAGVLCLILVLQYVNTLGMRSSKKRCPDCGGRNIKVRALRKADKFYWSGRALYVFKREGVCQDCGAVFGMISKTEVSEKWRKAGIRLQIGIIVTLIVVIVSIVVPNFILKDSSAASSGTSAEGTATADSKDYSVEFTVPATLLNTFTQEEADKAAAADGGYQCTVNADGSATFRMTEERYATWKEQYAANYKNFLQSLVGNSDYPNITAISVNDDFTEYTITLSDSNVSNNDARLADAMCYISGMYDSYIGAELGEVTVNFQTADGTVVKTVTGTATLDFNMDLVSTEIDHMTSGTSSSTT